MKEMIESQDFVDRIRNFDLDICRTCHGLGVLPNHSVHSTCSKCKGKGWIRLH